MDKAIDSIPIFDEIRDKIYFIDQQSFGLLYANRAAASQLDIKADDFRDVNFLSFLSDISEDQFRKIVSPIISGAKNKVDLEINFGRRGGPATYWASCSLLAIKYQGASVIGVVIKNISDVTKARSNLEEVNFNLNNLIDSVTIGLILSDDRGDMLRVNPAAEHIFGYKQAELIGKNVSILMPDPDRRNHARFMTSYLDTGERKIIGIGRDVKGLRANGEVFDMNLGIGEIIQDGQRGFAASIRDLSDRVRLEEQLREAHKMEVVGQLTGGIAHDFNNLLAVVKGNLSLMMDDLSSNSPLDRDELTDFSQEALLASLRGEDLVKQLLVFTRKKPIEAHEVHVDKVISEIHSLLRRSLGELYPIEFDLQSEDWEVKLDRTQLESAMMNMVLNARDAMGQTGTVKIVTRQIEITELEVPDSHVMKAGEYVLIQVIDNGSGMTPAVKQRAIEPFYTTKDVGQGTGLGLATVYGFVKQSSGYLGIDSEVGIGTTVSLYFPHAKRSNQTKDVDLEEEQPSAKGSERILVVEDERPVQRTISKILERKGYQVELASDAAEALEIFNSGEKFDVLLTDIMIPGDMRGNHLADALKRSDSNLKVLMMSGYAEDLMSGNLSHVKPDHFLIKPFSPEELLRKIRSIIEE